MTDLRETQLEQIRGTYAAYRGARDQLWDPSNPGFARLAEDRDRLLVDLIRRSSANGAAILDLGCGTGDLYGRVTAEGLSLAWTGVDLLDEPLLEARQRYPDASWLTAAADRLPFPDATFDAVVASLLFSSIPPGAMELSIAHEIGRVVRGNGWLIWYDLRYGNPGNPAVHGLPRKHVRALFHGWAIELRSITLLPPIARRLGRLTPLAYPLLHFVPPLRSHLVGRLRRPPG